MAVTVLGFSLVFVAFLAVAVVCYDAGVFLGRFRKRASFKCPVKLGTFANPNNCRRFYICYRFVSYDISCPPALHFDDAKKMCVYETKGLQCGPVAVNTPAPTTPDPDAAPVCFPPDCRLPDCFCSEGGTKIPGNLLPKETPQMVILTFSGALNVRNEKALDYILNDTKLNLNGCPIRATFFEPHEYTNYRLVQKMYGRGHEIALQTRQNREPQESWSRASSHEWSTEMIKMREILHTFANVSTEDMLGVRAPFLKLGGNIYMSIIRAYGLDYDSSLAVPLSNVPQWPYTLDYHMPHKCLAENCPSKSFPGVWEFPLNTFDTGRDSGDSCVFMEQCIFLDDGDSVFHFLHSNFFRHYNTNRAPFVLNLHVDWLSDRKKLGGLQMFINFALRLPSRDVWFVTMQQALQWMRNPVQMYFAPSFEAWTCPRRR